MIALLTSVLPTAAVPGQPAPGRFTQQHGRQANERIAEHVGGPDRVLADARAAHLTDARGEHGQ